MEMLQNFGRFLATIVGILLIIVGMRYAMMLFTQIYDGVTDPSTVAKTLDQWARYLASDLGRFEHNSALTKVEHLRIIALFIIAIGGSILAWISISLIIAGSKILQIASTNVRNPTLKNIPATPPVASAARSKKEPKYTPIPPRTQTRNQ